MRIRSLDGLRGIAVLSVIGFHCTVNAYPTGLFSSGWAGVDLFFVLSGFLITGQLVDSRGTSNYYLGFYIRRTLRIFPLYYAFLLVLSIAGYHSIWHWLYLTNVYVTMHGWQTLPGMSHLWSLAVEEQFYLIWPFVVAACNRRQLAIVCTGIVVFSLVCRIVLVFQGISVATYVLLPTRFDSLAIGALLALYVKSRPTAIGVSKNIIVVASILLVAGLYISPMYQYNPIVQTIGYPIIAGVAASMVWTALLFPNSLKGLAFFGKYSYAMYLFHLPLIGLLAHFHLIHPYVPIGIGVAVRDVLFTTAITTALAIASYHLWEKHFLKLKNRVELKVGTVPQLYPRSAESTTIKKPEPTF